MKKINKPTDDAVVISCQLIDQIRDQGGKDWADLLSLYAFYYHRARRQKTNRPWVTNKYAKDGLKWGIDKLKTRKTKLVSLGLLENHKIKRKDGTFGKSVVQVNYIWCQSHAEETPEDNTTTSVFSHQVATDQQMLKVNKNKCLNLKQKEERRKGDSTILENLNNSCTVIQEPSALSLDAGNAQASKVNSPATPSTYSPKKENKSEVLSREKYIAVMSKRFHDLCGSDGVHILNADLASNTRRLNWSKQIDYWEKRLSGIDTHQAEAWRLIAAYLRVFYSSNRHYPDTRLFFRGWRAIGWQEEKNRILSFCNTHNGVLNLRNYVEKRAEEGQVVIAKWLLSSNDYSRWFMRLEKEIDGGGYSSDDFENRPSGGFNSLSEEEDAYVERMKKADQEQKKGIEFDVIERATMLYRTNQHNAQIISEIEQAVQSYDDGGDLDKFKRSIEALETSQSSREVLSGEKT